MLYKSIAILLSAVLLVTVQISTASAGGCGRAQFHMYQANLMHQQTLKRERAAQASAIAAAKRKKAVQIARAERQAKAAKTAAVAQQAAAPVVAETQKDPENELNVASAQTCSKFVAATGTTVSVPCSQE